MAVWDGVPLYCGQISLSSDSERAADFSVMQVAELVATEFFEQGDKERRELNIEPTVSISESLQQNLHVLVRHLVVIGL